MSYSPVDVLRASPLLPDTVTMNIHPIPSRACLLCEAARSYTAGSSDKQGDYGALSRTGDVLRMIVTGR